MSKASEGLGQGTVGDSTPHTDATVTIYKLVYTVDTNTSSSGNYTLNKDDLYVKTHKTFEKFYINEHIAEAKLEEYTRMGAELGISVTGNVFELDLED